MLPIGLTLAYRDLCLKTSFKKDLLESEWMEPFIGFKNFITLTIVSTVVHVPFILYIWALTLEHTVLVYIPYASIVIILVPTFVFPHYYFHKLFHKLKEDRLKEFRELSKAPVIREEDKINKILLFLEKREVEKADTWLFDPKVLVEVLVVALMHVILVEILTILIAPSH